LWWHCFFCNLTEKYRPSSSNIFLHYLRFICLTTSIFWTVAVHNICTFSLYIYIMIW
jgi:hypothetical protein